jgi:hypothetical protein
MRRRECMIALLLMFIVLEFFWGCAVKPTQPMDIVQHFIYREGWRLSPIDKWSIQNKVVYVGMDAETVKMSWGEPYGFCLSCTDYKNSQWYYKSSVQIIFKSAGGKDYIGYALSNDASNITPYYGVVDSVSQGKVVGKKYSLVVIINGKLDRIEDKTSYF